MIIENAIVSMPLDSMHPIGHIETGEFTGVYREKMLKTQTWVWVFGSENGLFPNLCFFVLWLFHFPKTKTWVF